MAGDPPRYHFKTPDGGKFDDMSLGSPRFPAKCPQLAADTAGCVTSMCVLCFVWGVLRLRRWSQTGHMLAAARVGCKQGW